MCVSGNQRSYCLANISHHIFSEGEKPNTCGKMQKTMRLPQLIVLLIVYSYQARALPWLYDTYDENMNQKGQVSSSNSSWILPKSGMESGVSHVSTFDALPMLHVKTSPDRLLMTQAKHLHRSCIGFIRSVIFIIICAFSFIWDFLILEKANDLLCAKPLIQ
jgi:hypothetical protein